MTDMFTRKSKAIHAHFVAKAAHADNAPHSAKTFSESYKDFNEKLQKFSDAVTHYATRIGRICGKAVRGTFFFVAMFVVFYTMTTNNPELFANFPGIAHLCEVVGPLANWISEFLANLIEWCIDTIHTIF